MIATGSERVVFTVVDAALTTAGVTMTRTAGTELAAIVTTATSAAFPGDLPPRLRYLRPSQLRVYVREPAAPTPAPAFRVKSAPASRDRLRACTANRQRR